METTHYLGRRGFTILLIVMFISYVSSFASKINGSNPGGSSPRGKEYRLCGINNPSEDGNIFSPFCDKGYVFSEIKFADYGQPTGSSCKSLKHGKCGAPATLRVVQKNCLGKERCRLSITDEMFGPTHCKGPVSFMFSAICKKT